MYFQLWEKCSLHIILKLEFNNFFFSFITHYVVHAPRFVHLIAVIHVLLLFFLHLFVPAISFFYRRFAELVVFYVFERKKREIVDQSSNRIVFLNKLNFDRNYFIVIMFCSQYKCNSFHFNLICSCVRWREINYWRDSFVARVFIRFGKTKNQKKSVINKILLIRNPSSLNLCFFFFIVRIKSVRSN